MSDSKFVGVDGFSCGWFSVGFNNNGEYELKPFFSFVDLLAYYDTAKLILVDTPIGLTNGSEKRRCDTQARRRLHGSAKVFRPPSRAAMKYLVDHPGCNDGAKRIEHAATRHINQGTPKSITLTTQTLGIMPQIAEVDRIMLARIPNASPKIREVHPEICFWALNDRKAIRSKKDSDRGIEDRIGVLKRVEPRAREIFDEGRAKFRNNCVKKDDILDALVAAVASYRGWPCWFHTLPEAPLTTDEGRLPIQDAKTELPMEMVFWEPFRHFKVRIP